MPESIDNRTIYSLSEITGSIRFTLASAYDESYWVMAEVARLNFYPHSGHCYPDLVEKHGNTIKAQMRATIWSENFKAISVKFRGVTGEPLADGMKILFLATVTFHDIYGLSLNIIDIEPVFTLGEMARAKRETIEKLKKEGLFDRNRLLPLPLLPKRLAVISVETSRGYSDLITTLTHNTWGYTFVHVLFPAILQGDKAVVSIRRQLHRIGRYAGFFDAVAIIRGGGDDTGLSCYDHYDLAREVALFPLPVITGIGHSTNETVVEMIAHTNKITPTDVAHFLIGQFRDFAATVDTAAQSLLTAALDIVEEKKHLLTDTLWAFRTQTLRLLEKNRSHTAMLSRLLTLHALLIVRDDRQALDETQRRLNLLNPLNILKRGYSITWYRDKPLTDAREVKKDETMTTQLHSGKITSVIKSIQPDHGEKDQLR
jgi:exodeoxyribonuclease VII large subunit